MNFDHIKDERERNEAQAAYLSRESPKGPVRVYCVRWGYIIRFDPWPITEIEGEPAKHVAAFLSGERVCHEINGLAFPIRLTQAGPDNFSVQYGAEHHRGLDYLGASRDLGRCMMHALACDGAIDNTEAEDADG